MTSTVPTTDEKTYCAVHPDRETTLRCNKCERYMCVQCAVLTPVGYRCKDCVRQHENKFYSANQYDYVIVAGVCAVLTAIAGFIISTIGFLLLVIVAGLPLGGVISEAALRATQRRRGRYSGEIGAAGAVLGGLVGGMLHAYSTYSTAMARVAQAAPNQPLPGVSLDMLFTMTFNDIGLLIFVGIVAFAIYGRFRMKF
jgi:hypothetical protein